MPDQPQKRSPGRPPGGRAFERSDIVDAALSNLAQGGYAGLTMRGVARTIGASLATVQRHFATKEELWRGIVDVFFDRFAPPTVPAGGGILQEGFVDLLQRSSQHPGLIMALMADRSPGHEERFAYIADRLASRHEASLALIADLQQQGRIRPVDPDALLLLLNVGIAAVAASPAVSQETYGYDLDDPADRSRLAAALADIIGLGLRNRDN